MYEAKTHLSRLLDDVQRGQAVTITRHGVPVARLVPILEYSREDIDQAVRRLRKLRRGVRLGGLQIRDLINEGRRR